MDQTAVFEAERPRLLRIASNVLGDRAEAEDVVQNAWLRLDRTDAEIDNLPGWLTTVTTRLCLDRLRSRVPAPIEDEQIEWAAEAEPDHADDVALADTVGIALQVVLDRLSPSERVAFVLHDSFAVDFPTVAAILGTTPAAARKLASRARGKVAQPTEPDHRTDWVIVDAFLAAAREGDFARLLELLAPGAVIAGDQAAIALGTPARISGQREVAEFFNGAAQSALSVFAADRPGAAWFDRGVAKVVFVFTIYDGMVDRIDFGADPDLVACVRRRNGGAPSGH